MAQTHTMNSFNPLDAPLSGLIAQLGIIKTAELLNLVNESVQFFELSQRTQSPDKLHAFVLHLLTYHASTDEKTLLNSQKHYFSSLRKIAWVILFNFEVSPTQIASFYRRDSRFVKKHIDETLYLLEHNRIENEFLTLYDNISAQLQLYRGFAA